MNRSAAFAVLPLALLALAPLAVAGDDEPCDVPAADCVSMMAAKIEKKGWVGIVMDARQSPIRITKVVPGGPAEKAGIQVGDGLLELDGIAYVEANRAALERHYSEMVPGKTVVYTIDRKGKPVRVSIVLGRVPAELEAQWVGEHVLKHHSHPEPKQAANG